MAVGIEPDNQYIITLVKSSSSVSRFSMDSIALGTSLLVQCTNFSRMYEARPAGESFKPNPTVSGFVAVNKNKIHD